MFNNYKRFPFMNMPCRGHETDYGPEPYAADISKAALHNGNYRTVLWTGNHLQLTLMSIPAGGDIGLEMHPDLDQLLYIEEGRGLVRMGREKDSLSFRQPAYKGYAVFVPSGTWHNLINTGGRPLKLFSVYAPPNHPRGAVHQTKEIAEANEN